MHLSSRHDRRHSPRHKLQRLSRTLLLWLLVIVALDRTAPALRAQEGDYKALTEAGVEEHSLGHYEEARALFAKAHAINPNARTLWGMGIAAFEARQYVDAIKLLSAARSDNRKPLTPAQRKQTDSLLERSQAFVARVPLRVEPANARITIDGREAEPDANGVVLLDAGTHQVVASAEGYQDMVRSMRWSAGDAAPLELRLERNSADSERDATRPAAERSASPAATAPSDTRGPSTFGVLKWVALGGTAAALGLTGAGFALRQQAAADWNDDEKCPVPKNESCGDKRDAVDKWQTMAIAGATASGVFATLTIVFFVLDRKSERRQARTLCEPAFELGAQCRVSF